MNHNLTKYLGISIGALAVAMGFTESAAAQSTSGTDQTSAAEISEIIVTAQRREERARDVPISLTVASAAMLERAGIANVADIQLVTPGLRIDRQGPSTQPALRGITSKDSSPGNDANVAIYVDGVYQPSQTANTFEFPDVDRIEVAKGPQGTLFGRNATGGAIQIFTKKPTYERRGQLTASYGRFNDTLIKGYVNVPMVDGKAALSLAASYQNRDGYLNNLEPGGRAYGRLIGSLVRAKLLLEPTDYLSFLITAHYSNRDDDGGIAATPLNGNSVGRSRPNTIVPSRPYDVALDSSFFQVNDTGVSFKADADLGFATLRSITAYDDAHLHSLTESDLATGNFTKNYNNVDYETISQEVTLASQGSGRLGWVLGFYYFGNDSGHNPTYTESLGVKTVRTVALQRTKAYAVFGEATFAITDRLTAIAGLRYSDEKRSLRGHVDRAVAGTFPTSAPNAHVESTSFDSITPRFSLRYAVTPETNAYFTYSQGFKSGGYNVLLLTGPAFDPETVKAYEIGVKSAPTSSFSLNAAAFYYDYQDQQVQVSVLGPTGILVNQTRNAASSRIYGVDVDAVLQLTPDFSVNVAAEWLHARYTSFPNALTQSPRLVGGVPCLCGNVATLFDATDNQLIRAPDYSISIGANYRHEFAAGIFEASALLYFSDRFNFQSDDRVYQPSYSTLNARASFQPAGTRARFAVWGKNLTDETVISGTLIQPNADGVIYALPRTYGIEVTYSF